LTATWLRLPPDSLFGLGDFPELRLRVHEGRMNGGRFIEFLKALVFSFPGKIFLIVDVRDSQNGA
jgi:hypothetical protein